MRGENNPAFVDGEFSSDSSVLKKKDQQKRARFECADCGVFFFRNPRRLSVSKSGLRFCSKKCIAAYFGRERRENRRRFEGVMRVLRVAQAVRERRAVA